MGRRVEPITIHTRYTHYVIIIIVNKWIVLRLFLREILVLAKILFEFGIGISFGNLTER